MKSVARTLVSLVGFFMALAGSVSAEAVFQCGLKPQGYLGGCDNIYVRWFDDRPALNYTIAYADGVTVTVPGSRQDYSRTGVGCGWGGQIRITGNYATGGTCTAQYSGPLPHNRPCDQCSAVNSPIQIQNAANGRVYAAPGSIVAAYGSGLTTATLGATAIPLPVEMSGVRVLFGDNTELCGLFYISPTQINFQIPENAPLGLQSVTVTNAAGQRFTGTVYLTGQAPGVFTRDGNGEGAAAALFYPGVVVLYATGINPQALGSAGEVRLRTRGLEYPASWVGLAPGFVGLIQINVPMPSSALGSGASLFVNTAESQGFILVR